MKKVILFVCFVTSFFSCEKPGLEESNPTLGKTSELQSISNLNGILIFKSIEEFHKTAAIVGSMSQKEYMAWQDEYKFTSRYSEFQKEIGNDLNAISLQKKSSPVFYDIEEKAFKLNSVNTSYSKITDAQGLVIINDATYLFSAEEILSIVGSGKEQNTKLINSQSIDYKMHGILSTKVREMSENNPNQRLAPWQKNQVGNNIIGVDNEENPHYLKASLTGRYYEIPDPFCVICNNGIPRQSIDLEAKYFFKGAFGSELPRTPEKIETSWSFQVNCAPCSPGTYLTQTGSFVDSGIQSVNKTIYDGWYGDIKNLNMPVSASDYNWTGTLLTSTTTFAFSD